MNNKKVVSLLLAMLLMMISIVGCTNNNTESTNTNDDKQSTTNNTTTQSNLEDTSSEKLDPVHLVIYMLGDAPKDKDMVIDKLNELTKRDLNATVELKQTTWTDWQTKYNLLLTTGEEIDLITTHTWSDFYKYANQGAYLPLDNLLPKYAPRTWESIPESAWQDCTVKGNIYTVPSNFYEFTNHNFIYRDDLRKKYGLPQIKTMEDFTAFLDIVAEKEKGIKPFNASVGFLQSFYLPSSSYISVLSNIIAAKDYDHPRELVLLPFTDEYEAYVKENVKRFEKGYWSESILSSNTEKDFENGLTAATAHNVMHAKGLVENLSKSKPDWEIKYLNITNESKIFPVPSNSNGIAIPRSAKNPERALMLLDKLRNDKEYYDLTQYGIKGVHYDENEKGEYMLPEGVTESGFTPESLCTWAWRTNELYKQTANCWPDFIEINDYFKSVAKPNIFDVFYFDPYPVQAELAAINNVISQYAGPLEVGLVDPEEGLALLREQLKKAGADKLLEEVSKQFDAYLDDRGM